MDFKPIFFSCLLGHALALFMITVPLLVHAEKMYQEPWGRDSALIKPANDHPPLPKQRGKLTRLAEQVILFHQNVLSPVDGPRSHFRPTSSRYMLIAMRRYGFIKGLIMGCDRLLRENEDPWVYRTVRYGGILFKSDPTY